MKATFKKALAMLLCVWMLCTMSILSLAGSENPYDDVSSIRLSKTSLSMTYGGTASLSASVYPEGADSRVTWKSSDPALLQVDAYGNLTAAPDKADPPSGKKTVTITATSVANSKASASCTVTVDNDASVKLGVMLKTLLAAIKSLSDLLAEPAKELFQKAGEMIKQLLASEALKNLLGQIGQKLSAQA